ncbi:MAG TPA: CBS domain-containing protein [Gammaproteobacteria bacterium]
MTIEPLMSRDVHRCLADDTLDQAASRLWEHDCGSLPVCAGGGDGETRVIGMLTDRDICMAALFQGKPLRELKVADAMSRDIRIAKVDDRPEDVELMMRERKIRRIPVTDESGRLVGIVSLADFARAARADESSHRDVGVSERDVGHTLAAICEPGRARLGSPP